MQGHPQAVAHQRAGAHDLVSALLAETEFGVTIGQRMDEVGVDRRMRAECGHAQRLRVGVKTDMVHHEPVVETWLAFLRTGQRGQHRVHTGVAVHMHVDLVPGIPEYLHALGQHRRRHQPFAVVAIDVTGRVHLHQLREHGTVCVQLDGLGKDHASAAARTHQLDGFEPLVEWRAFVRRAHYLAPDGTVREAACLQDVHDAQRALRLFDAGCQRGEFEFRVSRAEQHVARCRDATLVHQASRDVQAAVVPVGAQQVGQQARHHDLVASLEEVARGKVDLRVSAHQGFRDAKFVDGHAVEVALMERAVPQHHRAVRAQHIEFGARPAPVLGRLVTEADEPVGLVGARREAFGQQLAVAFWRVGRGCDAPALHPPSLGRNDFGRCHQPAEEGVHMVVDESGQEDLVLEPFVDHHVASFAPRHHRRHVAHRNDAVVDHAYSRSQWQRLVHGVDTPRGEDAQGAGPAGVLGGCGRVHGSVPQVLGRSLLGSYQAASCACAGTRRSPTPISNRVSRIRSAVIGSGSLT